jgi:hypothetical protein
LVIGVVPRPDQVAVVGEFFELFKTPWELYREGEPYDVVVVTADQVPEVRAKLLLIFGAHAKGADAAYGIAARECRQGGSLNHRGACLPLFGSVLTFVGRSGSPEVPVRSEVAIQTSSAGVPIIRVGYDLFDEVQFLLGTGQPAGSANSPTLDLHIGMLREWILNAGIPLLEILPTPAGYSFAACLTHDIDFVGIKRHGLDHSALGFLYRATVGAVRNFARKRLSLRDLVRTWAAAASLPFVHLGWAKDFWSPFEWYLQVEKGLPATYFLIPFKGRAGEHVPGSGRVRSRRATAYDVTDIQEWAAVLQQAGCELGVHGIDAWHSVDKGRDESARLTEVTGQPNHGIRMHWLLQDETTPGVLDRAGYAYDSTVGYNDTVGYRAGTSQVFRPLGARTLLELPLHIQDGALFYSQRLDLSEPEAWRRCEALLLNAKRFGGVLTVLWHDRSHGPERFWGGFYITLIATLKASGAWFGSASQVVEWFRNRREVRFERHAGGEGRRIRVSRDGAGIHPPLTIRHHQSASTFVDTPWDGAAAVEVVTATQTTSSRAPSTLPIELCSLS